uniref:Uncharacterized protein n=1 Tax=Opuntia streptacantha TaxID=393608 RepID=A0A7C9EYV1_OPUST
MMARRPGFSALMVAEPPPLSLALSWSTLRTRSTPKPAILPLVSPISSTSSPARESAPCLRLSSPPLTSPAGRFSPLGRRLSSLLRMSRLCSSRSERDSSAGGRAAGAPARVSRRFSSRRLRKEAQRR